MWHARANFLAAVVLLGTAFMAYVVAPHRGHDRSRGEVIALLAGDCVDHAADLGDDEGSCEPHRHHAAAYPHVAAVAVARPSFDGVLGVLPPPSRAPPCTVALIG